MKIFNEKEKSYIFRPEDLVGILKYFKKSPESLYSNLIDDYYVNKNLRIRREIDSIVSCFMTLQNKSDGNKEEGRIETSTGIGKQAFDILKPHAKLIVRKSRGVIFENKDFVITIDEVTSPIRICILEIESKTEKEPPGLEEFIPNHNFVKCPLSAWDYFKRKIAVCGGPSSGKTETAKYISHIMNTEFYANSFHVAEYATTFIQKYNKTPSFEDQFILWHNQKSREKSAGEKCDLAISDCPSFLSYIYALRSFKKSNMGIESKKIHISKLYKRAVEDIDNYQFIVFLEQQQYKQNGVRYQTPEEAQEISLSIRNFLENHSVDYVNSNFNNKESIIDQILYLNKLKETNA